MPPKILDSHIHLWPSTATTPTDHTWMTPGSPLAKQHSITEYDAATLTSPSVPAHLRPSAFIYVETDRHLPSPTPEDIRPDDSAEVKREKVRVWARAPLEEVQFLKRVVMGEVSEGDGAGKGDGERLKGMVIWAPFHLEGGLFGEYMKLVGEVLGEGKARERVVGYRYLLQGRTAEKVKRIIGNEYFVANVKEACEKGPRRLAFDVGIDAHRDGIEALEAVSKLIEDVEEGVNFVLNHLCKPDLSNPSWPSFDRWASSIGRLSSHPNVYMKLSGALNEFSPATTPSSASDILTALRPYLDHVLQSFGAHRILFGSDWPVCNVGGPKGDLGNWGLWAEVVEMWMEEKGLSEGEREWIWGKSAGAAYGVGEFR